MVASTPSLATRSLARLGNRLPLTRVLGLLVVSALVARRAVLLGPLPPGLDGGQWLAIGRGLLGGEGRSTPGAYAPLVPLMAASLAGLLDPIAAVRLVALGSYLFVVVASAVAAGSMFGAISGAAVAAAVGSAGAVNEPLAFGGYPQQVALAALIVAGWAAARLCWVDGDERQGLWLLGAGLAVAALAHHVYYPLTLAVVGCICGLALLARSSVVRTVVVRIAAVSAASTLLALPTLVTFLRVGYAPPLDAVALSVVGAWGYGTREAPIFWLGTIMAGAAALLLTPGGSRGSAWTFAGAALTIGGASFLLSGEPRMLPVLLVGGLFGVASGLRLAADGPHPQTLLGDPLPCEGEGAPTGQPERTEHGPPRAVCPLSLARERGLGGEGVSSAAASRTNPTPVSDTRERGSNRLQRGLSAAVMVLVAALLVLPGDLATRDYLDFYRVLDPSLLAAAARVEAAGEPVAVRADRRGWPLGWWLEGLTEVPVAVGSDGRWLGIPRERTRAVAVAALFDGTLEPTEVRARAERLGVGLLLVRKWEWIGWERWLAAPAPAVEVIFDDDVTLLLRVLPPEGSAQIAGV